MRTVVELPVFTRQAERLFSEDEKMAVLSLLARNPLLGDEIPGLGGIRKLRVPASGRGKRGGARVIYYALDDSMPIYALLVYGKNERSDLSGEQRKSILSLTSAIKAQWKKRRRS
jgi:hypothetical protein